MKTISKIALILFVTTIVIGAFESLIFATLLAATFVAAYVQSHDLVMNLVSKISRLAKFHFSVQGGVA